MALITKFHIGEATTTTGTGPFALGGALTAHNKFSTVCSVGDTFYGTVTAVDSSGFPTGEFVSGLMTYSAADEVTITTIESSSNAGASVSFSAGTKQVLLVISPDQLGGGSGTGFTLLTTPVTYYVRTDGSDSNDGLADTAGGAFRTIQKAIATTQFMIPHPDPSQWADPYGTFPTVSILVQSSGDFSDQSIGVNRVASDRNPDYGYPFLIYGTSALLNGVTVFGGGVSISGFSALGNVTSRGPLAQLNVSDCGAVGFSATEMARLDAYGITFTDDTVPNVFAASKNAIASLTGPIVLNGSPNYTDGFCTCASGATVDIVYDSVTGSATGVRYAVSSNGIINTFGGGSTYLPGNSAGTTATGGQYL